jgi:hypothetical protein
VQAILFADDIALICENLENLKLAVQALKEYFLRRSLEFNLDKCKIMKFRTGGKGRYKKDDVFAMDGVNIEFVTDFCYLGVIFQPSGNSFARHIEKRCRAALLSTCSIVGLNRLSIETAGKLFHLKVAPIASYAIEVIWPYLTLSDLQNLERVKTRYFKRVLCLSKYNKSRYVYHLIAKNEKLFVTELKEKFQLSETEAYSKFCESNSKNNKIICDEFYQTETMLKDNWRKALFPDRNVFTRFACHGYHYIFCKNKKYHFEPLDECICKFCEQKCEKYHIKTCTRRKISLREASLIKW